MLQPTDLSGVTKELCITLDAAGTGVRVDHKITNHSLWEIELAPWALTVMRGGVSIIPLESYRSHDEALLPAQSIARWFYTDFTDPRWTMGKQYVRLRADATRSQPQKIGIFNKRGWCAHLGGRTLFVKRFGHDCNRVYPDQGCNNEVFVAGDYMEIESLGPLQRLRPRMTQSSTSSAGSYTTTSPSAKRNRNFMRRFTRSSSVREPQTLSITHARPMRINMR